MQEPYVVRLAESVVLCSHRAPDRVDLSRVTRGEPRTITVQRPLYFGCKPQQPPGYVSGDEPLSVAIVAPCAPSRSGGLLPHLSLVELDRPHSDWYYSDLAYR